jgi:hypothetical protein
MVRSAIDDETGEVQSGVRGKFSMAQPDPTTAIARFKATFEAKYPDRNPEAAAPAPRPTAKLYQLPLWPEPVRGAPNSFLRSALFAAIQGKTRTRGLSSNGTENLVKLLAGRYRTMACHGVGVIASMRLAKN